MLIEKLSFQVSPPDRVEDFITADEEIWNPWLRQQRGFLRKTYQRYANGRVDMRVFWASKKDWDKATASPELPAIEVKMKAAFLGVYQRLP